MMRRFYQRAEGSFSVDVVFGTPHCGIDHDRGNFRYEVEIEYTPGALDSNGFLLDNTYFRGYFGSLGPVTVSCELLAQQCAEHILESLGDRRDHVIGASVKIFPFDGVHVEAMIPMRREA